MPEPGNDRFGWIPLSNYLAINDRGLDEFRDFFVLDSTLHYEFREDEVRHRGRLILAHGLIINVFEKLALRHIDGKACMIEYRYHATTARPLSRGIFRYDNAHGGYVEYPGHHDEHHKHIYNLGTGKSDFPPLWIGADRRPTLHDVIAELHQWWEATGQWIDWPSLAARDENEAHDG